MSNKLTCTKHGRRIVATETAFLHKTGDCSTCDSKTCSIGSQTFSRGHVQNLPMANQVKNHPHSETSGERLLRAIFEEGAELAQRTD